VFASRDNLRQRFSNILAAYPCLQSPTMFRTTCNLSLPEIFYNVRQPYKYAIFGDFFYKFDIPTFIFTVVSFFYLLSVSNTY